jgi:hypothetical protein
MLDDAACRAAIAAGFYLDPRTNKWRRDNPDSGARYANTPRWGRYACEDHNISTVQPRQVSHLEHNSDF